MDRIRLGIVEDNPQMLKILKDYFSNQKDFEIVFAVADGLTAVSEIERKKPDVITLDIVLPELDGFGVMEAVKKTYFPKIVVLSALSQENFISRAIKHGASYYMIKPFDLNTLRARLQDAVKNETPQPPTYDKVVSDYRAAEPTNRSRTRSLEERITSIFITVGIPAHIKGFQFLREAIKLAIDNPEIINCITKKLYPSIADHFGTSSSKVERAIRHAIEVAWNRGKIENINTIFGVKIYASNEKPTNGEFIALVADKMLIEGA